VRNSRRSLGARTPTPRQEAITSGRTNPPVVSALLGSVAADSMRRARPRNVAAVKPLKRPLKTLEHPGHRRLREFPLTVEELWETSGPPHVDAVDDSHLCSICLQLRSHPVL
jgi:hypothetical protein